MRIIFDTNVLVSLAIGTLGAIQNAWEAERFVVLLSKPLMSEVSNVLSRPKLARYLKGNKGAEFIQRTAQAGEWVAIFTPYPQFSDPKDTFLLAMIRDGGANLLVTGDGALLELASFEATEIIPPRAFIEYLESEKG